MHHNLFMYLEFGQTKKKVIIQLVKLIIVICVDRKRNVYKNKMWFILTRFLKIVV